MAIKKAFKFMDAFHGPCRPFVAKANRAGRGKVLTKGLLRLEHPRMPRRIRPAPASFMTGLLAGVLLAFLVHHLLKRDSVPTQIPELASLPADQTSKQTIIGYLKRDGMGASIYESFHRAWAEGGDLVPSEIDDKSESRAHVTVSGLDHIFSPSAVPIHGLFTGDFTREVLLPNNYGILKLESAVFLPTDPSLYQFYVPAESTHQTVLPR